jgi:hypothetical protein
MEKERRTDHAYVTADSDIHADRSNDTISVLLLMAGKICCSNGTRASDTSLAPRNAKTPATAADSADAAMYGANDFRDGILVLA